MEGQNLPLYELVVWTAARKALQSEERKYFCKELQAGENTVFSCYVNLFGECGRVIFQKGSLAVQPPKVTMTPPFRTLY